ncbi:MAG: HEAT repeat domain-containing protein [Elusimicrobiales bacterium]
MKVCPECQYQNPDNWLKCEVCGRSVADVSAAPEPQERVSSARVRPAWRVAAALAAVGCGVWGYRIAARHFAAKPVQPAPHAAQQPSAQEEEAPEETPAYGGDTVALLRSMSSLKMPGEEEAVMLMRAFSDDVPAVRAQAAATAAEWVLSGASYIPSLPDRLLKAMADRDFLVRAQAARELHRLFSSPKAAAACGLSAAMRDAKFSAPLSGAVAAALSDGYEDVRAAAAALAGDTGGAELKEKLAGLVRSERDIPVAAQAAGSLARLGDGRGVKYLLSLMASGDDGARELAAGMLAGAGDARADGALRKLAGDASTGVRRAAQLSLQHRRREPAVIN